MEPASYYIPKEECLLDKVIVKRGEIYMADLDPVVGSEQGSMRPVLIIQNDKGNQYSPTTVVLPLTTKVHKSSVMPTHVILKEIAGLTATSAVMAEQIRTIDKGRLIEYIGAVPKVLMDTAIRKTIRTELDV